MTAAEDGLAVWTDEALRALAGRCVVRATDKDVTFATAESCTGGLIAHLVTDNAGASTAYKGGWVVYENDRKVDDLGVDASVLKRNGAVSEPVAKALAEGARERAEATFAIATTGIAGPTGGTPNKPVGLVWFGLATPKGTFTERFLHPDHEAMDRIGNKRAFAARALELLAAAVEAYPQMPEISSPPGQKP